MWLLQPCSLPASPCRCCQKHDCCYTHLKFDGCRSLTDNYKYSISESGIECCEYLALRAKGSTWEVLASPATIDPVWYDIEHVTPDTIPLSVGWASRNSGGEEERTKVTDTPSLLIPRKQIHHWTAQHCSTSRKFHALLDILLD